MRMIYILILASLAYTCTAQGILGQWETFDDESGDKKAVVEIYEDQGVYGAKIVQSLVKDGSGICESCKGAKKNQPIVGLVIIEGLEKEGSQYEGGSILDPENGKTYKCYLELEEADKLKVRGYLGFSLLGRTQYWMRKK